MEAIKQSEHILEITNSTPDKDHLYIDSDLVDQKTQQTLSTCQMFLDPENNTFYYFTKKRSDIDKQNVGLKFINLIDVFERHVFTINNFEYCISNSTPLAFTSKTITDQNNTNSYYAMLLTFPNDAATYCLTKQNKDQFEHFVLEHSNDNNMDTSYNCHIVNGMTNLILYNFILKKDEVLMYKTIVNQKSSCSRFVFYNKFVVDTFFTKEMPTITQNYLTLMNKKDLEKEHLLKIDDMLIEEERKNDKVCAIFIRFLIRFYLEKNSLPIYAIVSCKDQAIDKSIEQASWDIQYVKINLILDNNQHVDKKFFLKKNYIISDTNCKESSVVPLNKAKTICFEQPKRPMYNDAQYSVIENITLANYFLNENQNKCSLDIDTIEDVIPYYNIFKNALPSNMNKNPETISLYLLKQLIDELRQEQNKKLLADKDTLATTQKKLEKLTKLADKLKEQYTNELKNNAQQLEFIRQQTAQHMQNLINESAYCAQSYQQAYQSCLNYSQDLISKLPTYIHYLNNTINSIIVAGKLAQEDLKILQQEKKNIENEHTKLITEIENLRNEIYTIANQTLPTIQKKIEEEIFSPLREQYNNEAKNLLDTYKKQYNTVVVEHKSHLLEIKNQFKAHIEMLTKEVKDANQEIEKTKKSIADLQKTHQEEIIKLKKEADEYQKEVQKTHIENLAVLNTKGQKQIQKLEKDYQDKLQTMAATEEQYWQKQNALNDKNTLEQKNSLTKYYEEQTANLKKQNEHAVKTFAIIIIAQANQLANNYNTTVNNIKNIHNQKITTLENEFKKKIQQQLILSVLAVFSSIFVWETVKYFYTQQVKCK
ncbi:hypothetical protein EKK58_06620 [Candidatus Dependentiae bacterium]|nr:MAG: hypothetical protein EKK58_06620 [Candidatus Dependentiae bacterium]